jgi:SAM-dependent methyltransferase
MKTGKSSKEREICRHIRRIYADAGFLAGLYASIRLKLAPIVKIEAYVPASGMILDLGCGSGIFANILLLGSAQRTVKGIDLNPGRIKIARAIAAGNPKMEFAQGDAGSYPIERCAAVTLIDLLHHMEIGKQNSLLQQLYDGLSDGAVLLIKDLEKAPRWKYLFHYMQDSLSYRSKLYFRSAPEMCADLNKIGFAVEKISLGAGYMHPHVLYRCRKGTGLSRRPRQAAQ